MALATEGPQNGRRPLDAIRQSVEEERLRILDSFRAAIRQPASAAEIAVPTLQAAIRPQRQASLSTEENQLLENGLRAILQEVVDNAAAAGQPLLAYGSDPGAGPLPGAGPVRPGPLTRLLDITLHLCEHGNAEPGIVFKLFEDLTEVASIPDCKDVFTYIEGKHEVLGKAELLVRGKLVLLRACNHLIRRLSKACDVVFCGRILVFLTHFFPIYEKSAVNIKGHHNTANKTEYVKEAPPDVSAEDFTFYTTFWSLQEFFSNPAVLFKEAKWQQCAAALETVLSAFEAQPPDGDDVASSQDVGLAPYNAKFLTAPKILPLQLKDRSLRRQILLQSLILFHFLQVPLKLDKVEVDKRSAMKEDVKGLEARVKRMLEAQFSKGKDFLKIAEQVLKREENWVEWKRDGCQSFEKPAAAPSQEQAERPGKRPRYAWGNKELDKLVKWAESHPDSLTDVERMNRTNVRDHFRPLAEDLDPEAGIEEEYSHKKVKVYCWRGLRLAARQDMESFGRYADHGIEGAVPLDLLTEGARARIYPPKAAEPPKARAKKAAPPGGGAAVAPSGNTLGEDPQQPMASRGSAPPAEASEPTPMQVDTAPPGGAAHGSTGEPLPPAANAPTLTAAAASPLRPPAGAPEAAAAAAAAPTAAANPLDPAPAQTQVQATLPEAERGPKDPSAPPDPAPPAPVRPGGAAAPGQGAPTGGGAQAAPAQQPAAQGAGPSPPPDNSPRGAASSAPAAGQQRTPYAELPGVAVAAEAAAAAVPAPPNGQAPEEAKPARLPGGASAAPLRSGFGRSPAAIKAAAAASRALNPNPSPAAGGGAAAHSSSQPQRAGGTAFDLNVVPPDDPTRAGAPTGRGAPVAKRGGGVRDRA